MIVWFTGQPGSGKTTLALGMKPRFHVDGDDLRALDNPGYDEAGRRQNIDRAQAIAGYCYERNGQVVVSVVAPYRDQREAFKKRFPVLEVYLHTDTVRGKEDFFVDDYEPPLTSFVDIDTGEVDERKALRIVYRSLAAATSRA